MATQAMWLSDFEVDLTTLNLPPMVTEIARSMVMDFGMSRLGRINYRENPRSGFLGDGGFVGVRLHSEKTAWEIDQEIRQILETLYKKTRELLQSKRDILEKISERLLEKEVLDTEELASIINDQEQFPEVRNNPTGENRENTVESRQHSQRLRI